MSETVIASRPPNDGRNWDVQCARCGSSLAFEECDYCGGDGETQPGELYEQDPLWYDEDDTDPCSLCCGAGTFAHCLSDDSSDWCKQNPRVGRENIKPSTPEWFTSEVRR